MIKALVIVTIKDRPWCCFWVKLFDERRQIDGMKEQHEASVAKWKKQKDRIRLEKRSLATTKKQIENLKEEIRYALAHSQVAFIL